MIIATVKHVQKYNFPNGVQNFNIMTNYSMLFYIISGDCQFDTPKHTHQVHSGELYLTNSNYPHNFKASDAVSYITISFDFNATSIAYKTGSFHSIAANIPSLFYDVLHIYDKKSMLYTDLCSIRLNEILYLLATTTKQQNLFDTIETLIQDIETNNILNITITQMALRTGYSYDHFRHKFKLVTGISPSSYLTNRKINYACELIRLHKHSYTEIAMICGFSTSTQFNVLFKSKLGITPKAYYLQAIQKNPLST